MSSSSSVLIIGCVSDPSFHRCCKMAKILRDAGISGQVPVELMLETQYEHFLENKKTKLGGNIFEVL